MMDHLLFVAPLVEGYAFGAISMAAYTLDAQCPVDEDGGPSAGLPDPSVMPAEDTNL